MVEELPADRPRDRPRSVRAVPRLVEQVGEARLEAARARARHFGDVRYRRIRESLNAALDQPPLPIAAAPPHATTDAVERAAGARFGTEVARCWSQALLPKPRHLELSGILDTPEPRAARATRDRLSPTAFRAILLDDDLERRDQAKLARRVTASGVDPAKTLAGFACSAVPGLNRTLVADLAAGAFVARAQNVIRAGPTGVGKSPFMDAPVVEALMRACTAPRRPAHRILLALRAARGDGSHRRRLRRRRTVDLLALDDSGLRPRSPEMAEDLDELIRERHERKAPILTSKRALDEWPAAFANPLLASAALDRPTHRCHPLVIRGQSYRQRGRRKEDLDDHTPTEPPADGATLDPCPTPR